MASSKAALWWEGGGKLLPNFGYVEAPREVRKEGDGRGARVENSLRPQWQPVQRKSLTEITRNIHILSPPPHTPDANHYNRKPPHPPPTSPNHRQRLRTSTRRSIHPSQVSAFIYMQVFKHSFCTRSLCPFSLLPPRSTSPSPIQPPTHTLKRHILPLTLNMIRTPPIPILLERPPGSRLIRVPRARRSDGSRPRRFARHSLRGRGARRAGYLCHYNQLFALM